MDIPDESYDELYDTLLTTKVLTDPEYPEFSGIGGRPEMWNYWGSYAFWPRLKHTDPMDVRYLNPQGALHRISGPAYISRKYDIEAWFRDGIRHRGAGAAYRHKNTYIWFFQGKLHRADGPAVIDNGGPNQYWLDGVRLPPKEYKKEISRRKRRGLL